MIEFIDSRGVPVRVQDVAEADELEIALTGILGMEFDPLPLLQQREVRCPISQLIECAVRLSSMEDRQIHQATMLLGNLDQAFLDQREQGHLAACNHWINQEYELAHVCWRELLSQHPRDVVALFSLHMLEFNMGWTERMRETIVTVRPFWGPHTLCMVMCGVSKPLPWWKMATTTPPVSRPSARWPSIPGIFTQFMRPVMWGTNAGTMLKR